MRGSVNYYYYSVYKLLVVNLTTRLKKILALKKNSADKSSAKRRHINSTNPDTQQPTSPNRNRTHDDKITRQTRQTRRLWTNLCISTRANVRNPTKLVSAFSYPVYVRPQYKACAAACKRRKPLRMWTKNRLSTKFQAFTTTTTFIYISKLTKRAKRIRRSARTTSVPANRVYRKQIEHAVA